MKTSLVRITVAAGIGLVILAVVLPPIVAGAGAGEVAHAIGKLIGLGLFILLYFLPSLITSINHHRNFLPILILNFTIGWTLIGWVAALIWAVYRERNA